MMPLLIAGEADARGARARAEELLARGGAGGRDARTGRRSSRAASSSARRWRGRWRPDPLVLLADEPSGNLDHANSERLHDLLRASCRGSSRPRWWS